MKVELIGALNYEKLGKYIEERIEEIIKRNESIVEYLSSISKNASSSDTISELFNQTINYLRKYNDDVSENLLEEFVSLKERIINNKENISSNIIEAISKIEEINMDLLDKKQEAIEDIKKLEIERNTNKVAAAGRLSRYPGTVFEILETIEGKDFEKNVSFAKRVIGMGHDSITDHVYCLFAIKNVSPVIEQIIIAERFASFTIKSRREVDFSNVGFYTPDFHDENGKVIKENDMVKEEYQIYMKSLFEKYSKLVDSGIPKEDARFVLPYSYYSNIIMGIDTHTLKDMIIKFTKTKYSNIEEVRKFGEELYEIAKVNYPYIIEEIDKVQIDTSDKVYNFLENNLVRREDYVILDSPKLISATPDVDEKILISAIMRYYEYDYDTAKAIYKETIKSNPEFKDKLMKKISFEGDKQELTSVNFTYQLPLSFAVLTHLTRHRTHQMLIPDFSPNIDLTQYKTPPKIKANDECLKLYEDIYTMNKIMYDRFKELGIREEDLVYFTLSGNMVNVITNIDGKTLKHILGLRECTKAQWETRNMAYGMHRELDKIEGTQSFSKVLGATCTTQGYCKEGKESCGKIKTLSK